MGCSESLALKTSISIQSLSTLSTPQQQQCKELNENSFEENYIDFDTFEQDTNTSSYFYDKTKNIVVSIPKLGPVENSVILRRRKSSSIN